MLDSTKKILYYYNMITQTKDPATLKQSEDFKSYKFGIKAEGLSHIFNVLRNQLYSDKTLAVVREYSCNAFDAHVEAGRGDEPIEISLPTRMNPNFSVRDFGLGLSEKDIQNIYANYGESTKRNTNAQIGQLGLGCKSGFAYGDNFVIISYQNGCKTTYNAFIDPSQVGQISKMQVEKTKERDGIEIVVPVKDGDADNFVEKAQDLFKFWSIKPIVKGSKLNLDRGAVALEGEGWLVRQVESSRYGSYNRNDSTYAIMGNIAYPIEEYSVDFAAKVDDEDDAATLRSMASSGLEIQFEIGELEISASREALQYTDYTQKQIIKKLKDVRQQMVQQVTTNLTNADSMYEAKKTYGQVFDYGSPLYRFSSLFKGKVVYKGKPVGSDAFSLNDIEHKDVALKEYAHPNRGYKVRASEHYNIKCDDQRPIVINDCGMKNGLLNRIAPLIEMSDNHIGRKVAKVYLINPHNTKAWNKWKKGMSFDAPMIKLSELPAIKMAEIYPQAATKGSGYVKNAKHTTKVFEYNWKADVGSWHSKKSDFWNCGEVDLKKDSFVYVKMDKFKPLNPFAGDHVHGCEVEPSSVKNWKETLALAGIKMPKKIIGLKVKMFEGNKDPFGKNKNAVEFFSLIEKELKNLIKSQRIAQKIFDRNYILGHNGVKEDWMMAIHNQAEITDFADRNGEMAMFKARFYTMMHGSQAKMIDGIREVCKSFSIELSQKGLKPTHNLKSEGDKVMEKYEMLEFVGNSWRQSWGDWSRVGKQVINYINVIDVCGK